MKRLLAISIFMSLLLAQSVQATPILDSTTGVNWVGHYGQDGYYLFALANTTDAISLPSYISSIAATGQYANNLNKITFSATHGQGMEYPDGTANPNGPGCIYFNRGAIPGPMVLSVTPTVTGDFTMSLFLHDGNGRGYQTETIAIDGAGAGNSTDTFAGNFGNPDSIWASYNVSATAGVPVTITVSGTTNYPQLSGILFEPAPEPATMALLVVGGLALLRRRKA